MAQQHEASYYIIQLSVDADGHSGCSYLVPTAFFEDETRRPGAKKAFELLCQHNENIHDFNDPVYQLIINSFFDFEHTMEDRDWVMFAERYDKQFDSTVYSWKPFMLKRNQIAFHEKLRDARIWVEKFFNVQNEESLALLSAEGTTIAAFYYLQQ